MWHDTDKLIRQLSLVAFLMAERRPLTARDVKTERRGLPEMSDEAFARRFYSDRAELLALGVPLQSQRDEFTGEELYTLTLGAVLPAAARARRTTSSRRSRPRSTCSRGSSRTPSRSASRCRTSRSAGPGFASTPTPTALRVEVEARPRLLGRDARPARQARERDLEAADGRSSTTGRSSRDESASARSTRTRCCATAAAGTSSAQDLDDAEDIRTFRGLAHPRRHPLRDAARARLPRPARVRRSRTTAAGRPGRSATPSGEARDRGRAGHGLVGRAAYGDHGHGRGRRLRHRLRLASPCSRVGAAPGRPRAPARAATSCVARSRAALRSGARARTRARRPSRCRRRRAARATAPGTARPARSCPSASAVLQALLAYLLAACGDEPQRVDPGARARRALPDPARTSSRSTSRC